MPKLQLLSDVHGRWDRTLISESTDIVLALGDLTEGIEGVSWLKDMKKPVIYVPGNHEYYQSDLSERLQELKDAAAGTNVIIADKQTIKTGKTRFLCCTLWTDHFGLNPDLMAHSMNSLNDYRNISVEKWVSDYENQAAYIIALEAFNAANPEHAGLFPDRPAKMNPLVALVCHQQALDYLVGELEEKWDGSTIVLSHHAPSLTSVTFSGYLSNHNAGLFQNALQKKHRPHKIGAYANSLEYLLDRYKIDLWMHGHLHEGVRYTIHGTDIFSNPTGYTDTQNNRHHECFCFDSENPDRHVKLLCMTLYQSLQLQIEMASLVKKCIMQDERTSKTLFAHASDILAFSALYNDAVSPACNQRVKDKNRPEYLLEQLNIPKIKAFLSSSSSVDSIHRMRALQEMLSKIMENQTKTKEWLFSLNSQKRLERWTIEGDIL